MKYLALGAAIAAVTLTSGCASIFNQSTQSVNIVSSNGKPVQGAVDGKPFTTPTQVQVNRTKASKLITTETDGCAKQTVVEPSIDFKFWGNIIIGGFLGSSTDYGTERMWKYTDNVVIACQ